MANRGITIRCTRSRGPRGFFCLQVDRRGPVIVDVILLEIFMQTQFTTLLLLAFILCLGCSEKVAKENIAGELAYNKKFEPLIGEWNSEGEFALIVARDGDSVVIDNPPNELWQIEVSNVAADGGAIKFVQRHIIKDGSFNPFSGVECNCTLKPIDGSPNKLEFTMTTSETPDEPPGVYTRRH